MITYCGPFGSSPFPTSNAHVLPVRSASRHGNVSPGGFLATVLTTFQVFRDWLKVAMDVSPWRNSRGLGASSNPRHSWFSSVLVSCNARSFSSAKLQGFGRQSIPPSLIDLRVSTALRRADRMVNLLIQNVLSGIKLMGVGRLPERLMSGSVRLLQGAIHG